MVRFGPILVLGGCGTLALYEGDDADPAGAADEPVDLGGDRDRDVDGDGVIGAEDCDDQDREVYPGARDDCDDGHDADCDGEDCLLWDDDFESGALGGVWTVAGSVPWQVLAGPGRSGEHAAGSGAILDGQVSHLRLTIDAPGGAAVSFWHSGSTEATYDNLRFTVDGIERGLWSGSWAWTEAAYTLPAGTHDLVWTYAKDLSITAGQDTVLVDDILIEGGAAL